MNKKVPIRQCLGCRVQKPKKELVRVVRTPDGSIVYDSVGKVSGRGAYICCDKNCFEKALKSRAIERALNVTLDEELITCIKERINNQDE